METAIITTLGVIFSATLTFFGTKYNADKDKEKIVASNKNEIKRIEKDHKNEIDKLKLSHEQDMIRKEHELRLETKRNEQFGIHENTSAFMGSLLGDLTNGNPEDAIEKWQGLEDMEKRMQQSRVRQHAKKKNN